MGISWLEIRVGGGSVRSLTWCGLLRGAVLPGRKDERSEASSALGDARTIARTTAQEDRTTIARTTAQEDRTTIARTAPRLRGPHHDCADDCCI